MIRLDLETNAARLLAWGSLFTTIALSSWTSTDPVNYVKMICLAVLSFALVTSFLIPIKIQIWRENRGIFLTTCTLIILMTISVFLSTDPLSQNVYGVFGRNTGLITYICLILVFLSSSQIRQIQNFRKVINFFFYAVLVNVAYCLIVILGYDPIPWNNIFGAPLGTFGNPNFIGAFLGFGFTAIFAITMSESLSVSKRILLSLAGMLIFFEILKTNAIQGIVLSMLGVAFVLWIFLRSKSFKPLVEYTYLGFMFGLGSLSILGTFQMGPLSEYLYKGSVSLRGIYWNAGIKTGLDNFWFGAGMDSYGTWFRRSRDISKLGPDTMTNSAHNVFIDMFSSGGILLLIVYLLLTLYIAHRILQHILSNRNFDLNFVIIAGVWICYQAQSLISINQIGIAIWGWLLGGLIIGYTNKSVTKIESPRNFRNPSKSIKSVQAIEISGGTVLLSILGGIFGGLIAAPPYLADSNWRVAMSSRDAAKIESALVRWPRDPVRNSNGVVLLLENQLNEAAYKVAKQSTIDFPNDWYSWYNLGIFAKNSQLEREEIDRQMARLDPMNPKRPW